MPKYIPKKGDFIALTFDPQSGHEQKGRRPALVISNELFNTHTGLAIVCPVTNTDRRIPFHLPVRGNRVHLTGFVMVEQVKSIDFIARRAKFIGRSPDDFTADVLEVLSVCTE
jgi:mRNA interferase MazF